MSNRIRFLDLNGIVLNGTGELRIRLVWNHTNPYGLGDILKLVGRNGIESSVILSIAL